MKTTLSLVISSLLAVSGLQATSVIPPSFDELVGRAELIFQGTVTDVKSEWVGEGGQRHIVSYVTFQVDEAIKGEPGTSYTVRMLGGTVGDKTMEVSDSPKFKVGDRDILFVENNGKQFIPLVGIMHGRFRVERDKETGAEVVKSDKGKAVKDVAELGKDDHERPALQQGAKAYAAAAGLDVKAFKSAIRAKIAETE